MARSCRDPIRCLECNSFGHRAINCPRRRERVAARLPSPPKRQSPSTVLRLGSPLLASSSFRPPPASPKAPSPHRRHDEASSSHHQHRSPSKHQEAHHYHRSSTPGAHHHRHSSINRHASPGAHHRQSNHHHHQDSPPRSYHASRSRSRDSYRRSRSRSRDRSRPPQARISPRRPSPKPEPSRRLKSSTSYPPCLCPAQAGVRLRRSSALERSISSYEDKVVVTITEGCPSSENVAAALQDHWDSSWDWQVQRIAADSFLASFPSTKLSRRVCSSPKPYIFRSFSATFSFWSLALNSIEIARPNMVWLEILGLTVFCRSKEAITEIIEGFAQVIRLSLDT